MKHLNFTFLLTILMSMVGARALAYDAKIDGIYYNLSETEAEVTYYSSNYLQNKNAYEGSVTIPKSVNYNGKTYSVTSIGSDAFLCCGNLTSVTIPNSVTSIGSDAFEQCTSLTSVTIPNGVTSIGGCAFCHCSNLTSVTIGNSVTSIGNNAFYECSSLTSITIPNSVTTIGSRAFYGCTGLSSITIPNSVTSILGATFQDCTGLTSIIVESGNTAYDSRNNCNAIIKKANNMLIQGCQNTAIPNSVTSIGDCAFGGCSGLTSITIPNSVTSIGYGAFDGCSGLTSIIIPNSVTSIDFQVFYGCSGLTSIIIPNSVTSIGKQAFYECSSLISITIPNSVISIGDEAFYRCWGLTSLVSLIKVPFDIDYSVFSSGTYNNATLYVPDGTLDKYKATESWNKFLHIEEGATGINGIKEDLSKQYRYYDLNGNQSLQPRKGLNIVKSNNGNTKKVVVK